MGKVLLIDIGVCNGCYNCQIACKDEHVGNDWSPYAKPQPDTGQFWTRMIEHERGSVPRVRVTYMPMFCMHCDDAPCVDSCPTDAIYKRDDGVVIIDPEECRGHKNCIDACPYEDVIYFNKDLNIAQKCTFCAHLLDDDWEAPRCVDACPTDALRFGDEEESADELDEFEVLLPEGVDSVEELEFEPRVFYKNLPKRFVAGGVYDPSEDECVEGAEVVLTNVESGEEFSAVTDDFGDFWIRGLDEGEYKLVISKDGYHTVEESVSTVDGDVNVGDLKMYKRYGGPKTFP